MSPSTVVISPESFTTFGELLRHLRRRAHLTQRDLGTAVDYNFAQICRLEQNQRQPNPSVVVQHFIPALRLDASSPWALRLVALAEAAHSDSPPVNASTPTPVLSNSDADPSVAPTPTAATLAAFAHLLEPIPTPAPHEIRRAALTTRVQAQLRTSQRVALCGMAGMGKTTLAATAARTVARTYLVPVFWLTLTAQVNTTVDAIVYQLALFLAAQGQVQVNPLLAPPGPDRRNWPLDQQIALIQSGLAQLAQQTGDLPLLVFDNIHLIAENNPTRQLLQHLAATAATRLLVTSRESVQLPGCIQVRLGGLETNEAQALVARLHNDMAEIGGVSSAGLAANEVAQLVEKTGHSPMLLRLAVGQLFDAGMNVATLIAHLESQEQIALYLLETVQQVLSPVAWRLLQLIAVFRQAVNLRDPLLLDLWQSSSEESSDNTDEVDMAAATLELQRRQLIDQPVQAVLHPLLRDYAYAALRANRARRQQLHQLAAEWSEEAVADGLEAGYHYGQLGELTHVVNVLQEHQNDLIRRGQALAAAAVLEDALKQAQRRRSAANALVGQLLAMHGRFLNGTSRSGEAESSYRQALTLTPEGAPRADLTSELCQIILKLGRPTEVLALVQAAQATLSSEDTLQQARLALAAGSAYRHLSRYDESIRMAEGALGLADQLSATSADHVSGEIRARAHYILGVVMHQRSNLTAALAQWQASLQWAQQQNLPQVENSSRANICIIFQAQGKLTEAATLRRECIAQARAMGDSYNAGYFLNHAADLERMRGEFDLALAHLAEAHTLLSQVGDRWGLANTEKKQAEALISLGRVAEAHALMGHLVGRLDASAPIREYAEYLQVLAITHLLRQEVAQAHTVLQQALRIGSIVERPTVAGKLTVAIAMTLLAGGQIEDAAAALAEWPLRSQDRFVGFDYGLVSALVALAQKKPGEAVRCCQQVAQQAAAIGAALHTQLASQILQAIPAPPPLIGWPALLWSLSAQE